MRKKLAEALVLASVITVISGCSDTTADITDNYSESNEESSIEENSVEENVTESSDEGISNNIDEVFSDEDGTIDNQSEVSEEGDTTMNANTDLSKVTADVAFNLLHNVDLEEQNVLISPSSIMLALGMTMNGAKGQTLDEMQNFFCKDMSLDDYNQAMYEEITRLKSSESCTWNVADSIWINGDMELSEDFAGTVSDKYYGDVFSSLFDNSTVSEMNQWVNNNTSGMIKKIVESLPADSQMILLNALSFEGKWEESYSDIDIYEDDEFTAFDGTVQSVTMIHDSVNSYVECGNSIGFTLDYEGGDYAFMALLPFDGITPSELINELSGEDFINAFNSRTDEKANIRFPEFTNEYDTDISEALKNMGIETAFTTDADFSGFFGSNEGLFIDSVLHKTHIEVDREGTRAAAVTGTIVLGTALNMEEKSVILNRPFVYAIVDNTSGMPLFIGVVNSVD